MTQQELKNIISYNELNGNFYWKRGMRYNTLAGNIRPDGYIIIQINNKRYYAHRLAWFYYYGYFPENFIDHINKNTTDNRICNLREVSNQCNLRNSKNRCDNKSTVTGINWNKEKSKWEVKININQKTFYLGRFIDFNEAVSTRLAAEQCLDWPDCNSNSTAFKYVKKYILGK